MWHLNASLSSYTMQKTNWGFLVFSFCDCIFNLNRIFCSGNCLSPSLIVKWQKALQMPEVNTMFFLFLPFFFFFSCCEYAKHCLLHCWFLTLMRTVKAPADFRLQMVFKQQRISMCGRYFYICMKMDFSHETQKLIWMSFIALKFFTMKSSMGVNG